MIVFEKLYLILLSTLISINLLSNLVYQRFVHIVIFQESSIDLSSGTLLYPLSYFIINLITEFYGEEKANFAIFNTILMGFIISFIIFIISLFSTTSWSIVNNIEFNKIFHIFHLSFFSSLIASFVSQKIEIKTYLNLKKIFNSKYLWLLSSGSIFIGMIIDTFLIILFLVLIGNLPQKFFLRLIVGSYVYKIFILLILMPLMAYLSNKRE